MKKIVTYDKSDAAKFQLVDCSRQLKEELAKDLDYQDAQLIFELREDIRYWKEPYLVGWADSE